MKVNKLKFLMFAFFAAILFAACSGEDGEPGPQGEKGDPGEDSQGGYKKNGYLQGTVTGMRKDGTAFSEVFKYEYTGDSVQAFNEQSGVKSISIYRYLNSFADSYMNMSLTSPLDGVLEPSSATYSCTFNFFKELDSETLFRINARPYFVATEAFVRNLSWELVKKYSFSTTGNNSTVYTYLSYYYGNGSSTSAYQAYSYLNSQSYDVYYSEANGSLLGVYHQNTSSYLEDGEIFDLYNELKFVYNDDLGMSVFVDATTGDELFESIPDVPADALTITNYNHDTATGILSFDFELQISGYISSSYRENTTGHDLTITGSYNSGTKVYKNSVGRLGN